MLIGGFSALSYLAVLGAYRIAPVSYAGAIREVSIVGAALAGWWTGEAFGPTRLFGSGLIFSDILVIAMAG
jgi:drug/metabolite transporter (DMT)-like permease